MSNLADGLFSWKRDSWGAHRFDHVFTKLRLFEACTDYDKVLCMDIDTLVVDDMDHLFDLPAPAAMITGTVCRLRLVTNAYPYTFVIRMKIRLIV